MLRKLILLCGLLLGPAGLCAAAPGALLTILDGDATMLVGARAVAAAAGLRLPAATIVDTTSGTALLRLEWDDGAVLDLGPATRVMLAPVGLGSSSPPAFYLLQGWAKYSSQSAEARHGWLSPTLDVSPLRGVTVAQVDDSETRLFIETGNVQLIERVSGVRRTLASGDYLGLPASGVGGRVAARPAAAMLQKLPASFRDTIPTRAAEFKGRELEPRAALAPSYAELQPWLIAEPALRRDFPRRFSQRLREDEFRNALAAHVRQHPEWQAWLQGVPATTGGANK